MSGVLVADNGLGIRQDWLSLSKFEAESTIQEKVQGLVNHVVTAGGLFAAYSFVTGGTGLAVNLSYLAFGLATRKVASTTIGYLVYPAAFSSLPCCGTEHIHEVGRREIKSLVNDGFHVKKITIIKSGTEYDAVLVTHKDTVQNGNWAIHALGNGMNMEFFISDIAKANFEIRCNTLLMNGPSVGKSGGWPTRYQMGAGFEAGIRFLEEKAKATHIIMCGLSLGGGMMGEAILNHDFTEGLKNGICYLSISDRSFSRLSKVAGVIVKELVGERIGQFVEPIFYATGTELDGVAAARKLSQLGIKQIIIQHSGGMQSDGVIPDQSSLAHALHQDINLKDKVYLESQYINHNGSLPKRIEDDLMLNIRKFIENQQI